MTGGEGSSRHCERMRSNLWILIISILAINGDYHLKLASKLLIMIYDYPQNASFHSQ